MLGRAKRDQIQTIPPFYVESVRRRKVLLLQWKPGGQGNAHHHQGSFFSRFLCNRSSMFFFYISPSPIFVFFILSRSTIHANSFLHSFIHAPRRSTKWSKSPFHISIPPSLLLALPASRVRKTCLRSCPPLCRPGLHVCVCAFAACAFCVNTRGHRTDIYGSTIKTNMENMFDVINFIQELSWWFWYNHQDRNRESRCKTRRPLKCRPPWQCECSIFRGDFNATGSAFEKRKLTSVYLFLNLAVL